MQILAKFASPAILIVNNARAQSLINVHSVWILISTSLSHQNVTQFAQMATTIKILIGLASVINQL